MATQNMSQNSATFMPSSTPEDQQHTRDISEGLTRMMDEKAFDEISRHEDFPVAMLKIPGQEERPLTPELASILLQVAEKLSKGKAIVLMECDTQLTTQEAADMLGVSRPTLIKLLEQGKIPYSKVGRHRRIMLDDLQQYAQRRHAENARRLEELSSQVDVFATIDNPLIRN